MLEKLKADLLEARKLKDAGKLKAALLGTVIGELEAITKAKSNNVLDDGRIVKVIQKFVESAKEVKRYTSHTSAQFAKANAELEILYAYLPKMMDDTATRLAIIDAIAFLQPYDNRGNIMKWLKDKHGAVLDGKLASNILKEIGK